MYNISLKTLLENQAQRLEWKSSDAHRQLCTLKGKQETDCQNYIRVYSRPDDHTINVCGTNSFKPLCRTYKIGAGDAAGALDNETMRNETVIQDATAEALLSALSGSEMPPPQSEENTNGNFYRFVNEVDGQGRCPYNPTHNSSYIFTDGQLYSATVADFSGGDALIYRGSQRTEQYNAKQLNEPAFVSTVERNGYVFFFFREIALENSNCGKTVYSRVGRVCKNDRGGPLPVTKLWTSYLKTRLNCSIPGDFPFYFDEIRKCFAWRCRCDGWVMAFFYLQRERRGSSTDFTRRRSTRGTETITRPSAAMTQTPSRSSARSSMPCSRHRKMRSLVQRFALSKSMTSSRRSKVSKRSTSRRPVSRHSLMCKTQLQVISRGNGTRRPTGCRFRARRSRSRGRASASTTVASCRCAPSTSSRCTR